MVLARSDVDAPTQRAVLRA